MLSPDRPSPVQSVDRAIEILEHLADHGEAGATELAAALGVHKSTAFRLLGALEARRLVEQPDERGKYRLGLGVVRLASAVTTQRDVSRLGRPVLEALAQEIDETVSLAVWNEGHIINIDEVTGSSSIISQRWIGEQIAAHATSSGKVLMAFEPTLSEIVGDELPRFTEHTIVTREALLGELAEVRRTGLSRTREELEVGLHAIAAPVRAHDGRVIASISVSGPNYRLDEDKLVTVEPLLRAAAAEVSARLGWAGTPPHQPPEPV